MPLTTTERGYGAAHQQVRARYKPLVLAGGAKCARCGQPILPWQPWDLGHVPGDRSKYQGPEHRWCNRDTSSVRRPWQGPVVVELEPERDGVPQGDRRWRVPWLKSLLKVPEDATWPRLMTKMESRFLCWRR